MHLLLPICLWFLLLLESEAQSCSALYGQCGGIGWGGPTSCCDSGVTCQYSHEYYSQCLEAPPTSSPTPFPTAFPTAFPTPEPTPNPTPRPTENPTPRPTTEPTLRPTKNPTPRPTAIPTQRPTENPTSRPTESPTSEATANPTVSSSPESTSTPSTTPVNVPSLPPISEAPTSETDVGITETPSATIPNNSPTVPLNVDPETDSGSLSWLDSIPMGYLAGVVSLLAIIVLLGLTLLVMKVKRDQTIPPQGTYRSSSGFLTGAKFISDTTFQSGGDSALSKEARSNGAYMPVLYEPPQILPNALKFDSGASKASGRNGKVFIKPKHQMTPSETNYSL